MGCEYCYEEDNHITGKVVRCYEFKTTAGYKMPDRYRDYLALFTLKGKNDKKAGLMIENINGCRYIDVNYCPFCGRKLGE